MGFAIVVADGNKKILWLALRYWLSQPLKDFDEEGNDLKCLKVFILDKNEVKMWRNWNKE